MPTLEGRKAPHFSLTGSDGRLHRPADYAGRTLVLYFYPRDNTPGCTSEACSFRDLYPEFSNLDAVLLGVSRDSLASHDRFIGQFKLPFVLLSDPDTKMMQAYGAFGPKKSFGKTVMGVIRSTVVIDKHGIIVRHWPTVAKAEAHPGQVLEFLKSME